MRFWWSDWEARERSPSSDSDCSTASHSSLASDASFYSAGTDEIGLSDPGSPGWDESEGVGLSIVDPLAPVLDSTESDLGAVRAVPFLGTCGELDGATSGTDRRSAAPIVQSGGTFGESSVPPLPPSPVVDFSGCPSDEPAPPILGLSMGGLQPPLGAQATALAPFGSSVDPPRPQARRLASHDPVFGSPARLLAGHDPRLASSGLCLAQASPQDPAFVGFRPGRAGGMLPDPGEEPGAALVAATARALGAAHGPSDFEDVLSDVEDVQDDPDVPGFAVPMEQDLLCVECPPEGAAGMLPDGGAPALSLGLATAVAPDLFGAQDVQASATSVPMDVDQGTLWLAGAQPPPSPPQLLRVGGKRRRLNATDGEDDRELAEHWLEKDEAGSPYRALRLSAASVCPASVLSVFVHNAQQFRCTLCTYTAASFASLRRHRDTRHRRIAFLDRFSAGCACGIPFESRLAAHNHAQACAGLSTVTLAATAPAAGDLSPTVGTVNAPAQVAQARPPCPDQAVLDVSPPQSSTFPDDRTTDSRWHSSLPRVLVAQRVADRLSAAPAPRWGPPLPRRLVASRIADRLLPQELTIEEETKDDDDSPEAAEAVVAPGAVDGEWLLRFDGACRANPGPGGAGAALFRPSGSVVWTCSHYMPSSSETNNTAEYTALLLGARAAADHGAAHLRVEGDSNLVIQQVRGIFATRSQRLRPLKTAVKAELARMVRVSLHHIDRQANGHADRLANAALDRGATQLVCGVHLAGHDEACTCVTTPASTAPALVQPVTRPMPRVAEVVASSEDDDMGDIDDGEVYAAMRVGPAAVPQRRSRLRLRKLDDAGHEAARDVVERLATTLAAKITDACDWDTAEGYITALPISFTTICSRSSRPRVVPRLLHHAYRWIDH